ncbi:MAG: hypothetical protein WHT06_12090 [Desulfobacterales bacterium]
MRTRDAHAVLRGLVAAMMVLFLTAERAASGDLKTASSTPEPRKSASAASPPAPESAGSGRHAPIADSVNRLCRDIDDAASKLRAANQATREYLQNGSKMNEAESRTRREFKQAYLPTTPPKEVVARERSEGSGAKAGDLTRAGMKGVEEIRLLRGNGNRMKGSIVAQLREVQKQLAIVDAGARPLGRGVLAQAPERRCLPSSLQGLAKERKAAEDLSRALKAQQKEMNSNLSTPKVDEPRLCNGCNPIECRGCCTQKNPVSATPGSPLREVEERNLAACFKFCENRAEFCSAFGDATANHEELLRLLSEVLKKTTETETGILRNLP